MSWSNCVSWRRFALPELPCLAGPREYHASLPLVHVVGSNDRAGWQVHARPNEPCLAAAPGKSCKVPACVGQAASLPSSNHKKRRLSRLSPWASSAALKRSHRLNSKALPAGAGALAKAGPGVPVDKKIAAAACPPLCGKGPGSGRNSTSYASLHASPARLSASPSPAGMPRAAHGRQESAQMVDEGDAGGVGKLAQKRGADAGDAEGRPKKKPAMMPTRPGDRSIARRR